MRFLVTSYDSDQQQWFYDQVEALTADAAETHICLARPYVLDADAMPVEAMDAIVFQMRDLAEPDYDANQDLHACQDCEAIFETRKLEVIQRYYQRVARGEEVPSGQCPECGALCHPVEEKAENA